MYGLKFDFGVTKSKAATQTFGEKNQ